MQLGGRGCRKLCERLREGKEKREIREEKGKRQ